MAEDKPMEAKEMHKETTTTTTSSTNMPVEAAKGGNGAVKIIIIIVVILCLCSLCSAAAYVVVSRFIVNNAGNITGDIMNQAIREAENQAVNGSNGSNSTGSGLDINGNLNTGIGGSDANGSFNIGGDLPSGFPSDVPIFSNSKVAYTSSSKNADNGKDEYSATFTADAKVADVINFYKSKLPSNGWDITAESNFFGSILEADKGDRKATVVVFGDDTKSDPLTYTLNVEYK